MWAVLRLIGVLGRSLFDNLSQYSNFVLLVTHQYVIKTHSLQSNPLTN